MPYVDDAVSDDEGLKTEDVENGGGSGSFLEPVVVSSTQVLALAESLE